MPQRVLFDRAIRLRRPNAYQQPRSHVPRPVALDILVVKSINQGRQESYGRGLEFAGDSRKHAGSLGWMPDYLTNSRQRLRP